MIHLYCKQAKEKCLLSVDIYILIIDLLFFGSFALFIGDNILKKGKYSEFNLILYIIGGKVKVFGRKVVYKLCM